MYTWLFVSMLVAALLIVAAHNQDALARTLHAARSKLHVLYRYGSELGGYVHDTSMTQFIPPGQCHYITGTWTDVAGSVANTIVKEKTAADTTSTLTIPITIPQNSVGLKGGYLKSVDIWWTVTTAALDALTATIYKATLPANGAAFSAPASQAFTYDAGHDTAAERLTLDEHKMTVTITNPAWLDDDDLWTVQLSVDNALTSVFRFHGARANFTLRL